MCPPGFLRNICVVDHTRRSAPVGDIRGRPTDANSQNLGKRAQPVHFSCSEVCDLTHTLFEGFPTFSGEKWFEVDDVLNFAGDGMNLRKWRMMEHTGTHVRRRMI